ncbi:spore gernimation protein [Paenibacillus mesophilus]|uniref:GerAB/ArcD/ProY family transporter n=1 Tax=Paenibacillus mesophilus TaxID=2582849 RepID=UPI00110F3347|nr:GerAB/ArcD/ProY family transporter [Paenibacillus mesophilus]TMV52324.1 spore gernimation protein [Paenibacillus mesophilus]
MKEKLSSFHLAILINMTQTGVVILVLPHLLARYFGTNGWLALIIVSAAVSLSIGLITAVYRLGEGQSIFEILERFIPGLLLYPFYISLICIWALLGCLTAKYYVLVFQMVAFPTVNPMAFKVAVDVLAFFLIIKTIYNISKAATVFFWMSIWMLLLLFFFYGQFQWARLTPFVFQDSTYSAASFINIFPAYLGYELCLLLIPYCDRRTKFGSSVLIGHLLSTVVYLYVSLVSYGFHGYELLRHMQFPLMNLFAYVQLPFIQATENLLYGFLLFTTLITAVMYFWSAKEVALRMIPKKRKLITFVIVFLAYWISFIPDVLSEVQQWLKYLGYIEIGLAFGLPLGLIALLAVHKRRGRVSSA